MKRTRISFEVVILQFSYNTKFEKKNRMDYYLGKANYPSSILVKWNRGKADSGATKLSRLEDDMLGVYPLHSRFSFHASIVRKDDNAVKPVFKSKMLHFKIYQVDLDTQKELGLIGKASVDISRVLLTPDGTMLADLKVKKKTGIWKLGIGSGDNCHTLSVSISVDRSRDEDLQVTSETTTENSTFDSPHRIRNSDRITHDDILNSLNAQEEDISEVTSKDNVSHKQLELYSRGVQVGSRTELENVEFQLIQAKEENERLGKNHEIQIEKRNSEIEKLKTQNIEILKQLHIKEQLYDHIKHTLTNEQFSNRKMKVQMETFREQIDERNRQKESLFNEIKATKSKYEFLSKQHNKTELKYIKRKEEIAKLQKLKLTLQSKLDNQTGRNEKMDKRLEKKNIVLSSIFWGLISSLLYACSIPYFSKEMDLETIARKTIASSFLFGFLAYSSMKIGKKFKLRGSGFVVFIENPDRVGKEKMRLALKQSLLFGIILGGISFFIKVISRRILKTYGYSVVPYPSFFWNGFLFSLFESIAESIIGRMFFFIMICECLTLIVLKCQSYTNPKTYIQKMIVYLSTYLCKFKNSERKIAHHLTETNIIRVAIFFSSVFLGFVKLQFLKTYTPAISTPDKCSQFVIVFISNWLTTHIFVMDEYVELSLISYLLHSIIHRFLSSNL